MKLINWNVLQPSGLLCATLLLVTSPSVVVAEGGTQAKSCELPQLHYQINDPNSFALRHRADFSDYHRHNSQGAVQRVETFYTQAGFEVKIKTQARCVLTMTEYQFEVPELPVSPTATIDFAAKLVTQYSFGKFQSRMVLQEAASNLQKAHYNVYETELGTEIAVIHRQHGLVMVGKSEEAGKSYITVHMPLMVAGDSHINSTLASR